MYSSLPTFHAGRRRRFANFDELSLMTANFHFSLCVCNLVLFYFHLRHHHTSQTES